MMSAEITSNTGGILTVKITGKLTYADLLDSQKQMVDIASQQGHIRILVIADHFEGWDKSSNWADDSFQVKSDSFIEKMAIIGDKKWEELVLMFTCQGFRPFPIEYFQADELTKAKTWLTL